MESKSLFYPVKHELSEDEKKKISYERLVFNVTEDILIAMEDAGITQHKLATILGKSKSFVSQILNGKRNMTLRTLSNICFALDLKPTINIYDANNADVSHEKVPDLNYKRMYGDDKFINTAPVIRGKRSIKILISDNSSTDTIMLYTDLQQGC
ncbi:MULTISPECIES: helix-turn-helix transcriptional regulator [Providencia]|uniref:Helix-turn-helix transcriptional regulator n=2 Tax=Providencia TaxID=586 RepID=A0ABU2IWR5_9GAMM|nr:MULTISPECIES: helix-turn-helix transcriptional regulator [Providencia]MBO8253809.1 helix-turn-helix transcriptional regulator [Providencia rettgeri]MBO8257653.1 helix-turn-helix transcriptional regulator [Providencia rettgeri]MDE4731585.1 helix-turn-helix transcriptional regulator [Providencia rettgeri]MDH2304665.1 helix-turn-helix transcriptional regulator [Providencia rettgeri]MDT0133513.1 helix-turn-helix transcriptional regulator [Providencia huaxiensis]